MDPKRTKLLFGGLIGFSVIALVQIASAPKTSLDFYLTGTVISFTISLPLLILGILISYFKEDYKKTFEEPRVIDFIVSTGVGFCVLGIVALFWHFGGLIGGIFLFSSLIASGAFLYWDGKNKRPERQDSAQKEVAF
jgi:uncharacterized membrane protein